MRKRQKMKICREWGRATYRVKTLAKCLGSDAVRDIIRARKALVLPSYAILCAFGQHLILKRRDAREVAP